MSDDVLWHMDHCLKFLPNSEVKKNQKSSEKGLLRIAFSSGELKRLCKMKWNSPSIFKWHKLHSVCSLGVCVEKKWK